MARTLIICEEIRKPYRRASLPVTMKSRNYIAALSLY